MSHVTHLIQLGKNRVFGFTKRLAKRADMVPAIFDASRNAYVPVSEPVQQVRKPIAIPVQKPVSDLHNMPPAPAPTIVEPGTETPVQEIQADVQPPVLDPISETAAVNPKNDELQELQKKEIIGLAEEKFGQSITGRSKNDLIMAFRMTEKAYLLEHPEAAA